MLVLDGCFIIELLRNNEIFINNRNKNTTIDDKVDPVFSVSWVLQALYHDLILLENQIPWFVLVLLFEMTPPAISSSTKSLIHLAQDFFVVIFSMKALSKIDGNGNPNINHILDLLRTASGSSSATTKQQSLGDWKQIPNATSLKKSGIRFKKGTSNSNLLDITFKYGVLEIPSLLIQDATCEAFRNLISYEQCYYNCEAKITSYAVFLNNLINTTEDIEILQEVGIVDSLLNSTDTLEFFKNIYTDTYVKEFYYIEIYEQLRQHTNQWWPKTRAAYARKFGDPIGSLTLYAAAIALILTLLQTLYTMRQFYKDNKKDPSPPPPPPS